MRKSSSPSIAHSPKAWKPASTNSQGNINISKLVDEINASNRYIKQLVDTKSKSDSLNVVLTNNLTRSLSREALKEVDVKVPVYLGQYGRYYALISVKSEDTGVCECKLLQLEV